MGRMSLVREERKLVKHGLGFVYAKNSWTPVAWTAKQAQRYAERQAAKAVPKGVWHGTVCDCGSYLRVAVAGMRKPSWMV